MPAVLEKRVKALIDKWMDENKARAIATSSLQKEWKLKKKSKSISEKRKKAKIDLYYT